MKAILCALLVCSCLAGTLKLNLDSSIAINPGQRISLPLSCTGSTGAINDQVKGLPKGLSYRNGVIEGTN